MTGTKFSFFITAFFLMTSCIKENPNVDKKGQDEFKAHVLKKPIDTSKMQYKDVFYIPIYSDIYVTEQNQRNLLAATLSIRNTSFTDSLFISKIDYYSTDGKLVKQFLNGAISMNPQSTINYVIEKEDNSGGSGANFIVELRGRNKNMKPYLQSIMIGENGKNQGFAFTSEGLSIKE